MLTVEDWTQGVSQLLGYRCDEGHVWYFPRIRCSECGSPGTAFDAAGSGEAVAVTSLHRRSDGGSGVLRIALVKLDSGIQVMTRAGEGVEPGLRVVVNIFQDPKTQQLHPKCEVSSE